MSGVPVCTVGDDTRKILQKLRSKRNQTENTVTAVVLKIDKDKKEVVEEESYEDCTIEEVALELTESQPRYIVFVYAHKNAEGRKSYPYMLFFSSPEGCKTELQMMYAGTRVELQKAAGATKVLDIRGPQEFTEETILNHLSKIGLN